jgi:hypothetical protein
MPGEIDLTKCLRAAPLADAGMSVGRPICPWCERPITPRRTGGRLQKFCSEHCRRASERAMRDWAREQLTEGRVTIAEIKRERWSEPDPTNPRSGATCPSGEPRALS